MMTGEVGLSPPVVIDSRATVEGRVTTPFHVEPTSVPRQPWATSSMPGTSSAGEGTNQASWGPNLTLTSSVRQIQKKICSTVQ